MEEKLQELFDNFIVDLERAFDNEASVSDLWLGDYNKGFGHEFNFPDGRSFCISIEHINDEPDDYDEDDDDWKDA